MEKQLLNLSWALSMSCADCRAGTIVLVDYSIADHRLPRIVKEERKNS
jgi:hypothetical protein